VRLTLIIGTQWTVPPPHRIPHLHTTTLARHPYTHTLPHHTPHTPHMRFTLPLAAHACYTTTPTRMPLPASAPHLRTHTHTHRHSTVRAVHHTPRVGVITAARGGRLEHVVQRASSAMQTHRERAAGTASPARSAATIGPLVYAERARQLGNVNLRRWVAARMTAGGDAKLRCNACHGETRRFLAVYLRTSHLENEQYAPSLSGVRPHRRTPVAFMANIDCSAHAHAHLRT